jgi:hypothetical protein
MFSPKPSLKSSFSNSKKQITIEEMYPDLSPGERDKAADTLRRYLNLVWRIYARIKRENPEKLTKILLKARFKRPRP